MVLRPAAVTVRAGLQPGISALGREMGQVPADGRGQVRSGCHRAHRRRNRASF